MFGHQDDQSQQQQDTNQIPQQSIDNAMASETSQPTPSVAPPMTAPNSGRPDDTWQHPGTPLDNDAPASISPALAAVPNSPILPPGNAIDALPADIPVDDDTADSNDANDLIDIKQQALNQLSPLVGHLDQSPEEKFRTTMMMIQASDNQSMIKTAFEAAQAIPDEKVRAQALLDVVNEINYFTQNQANGQ